MLGLFYFISIFTKLLSTFVSRARESSADAHAALWTQKPCALSHSVAEARDLRKQERRQHEYDGADARLDGRCLSVNPFTDGELDETAGLTAWQRLRRWWQMAGQNHPPVAERLRVPGPDERRFLPETGINNGELL